MEDELVNLHFANEEEEAFQEDPKNSTDDLQFCLVGSCLTNSVVHFPSLRNTLVDLWHPIEGVTIMDLREKHYMFKFFYVVDMNRVVDGIPWSFTNHNILLQKLEIGEDNLQLSLHHACFGFKYVIYHHDLC
ncbi:hypothetical protein Gogos_017918 [Gossypium gossypioides]|uniref:DUF4283 domain-containing protein n=1 Tax=Gossypium gossypioides TaxID=34282 RepID=A0A7J9BC87_GOSGO|nr:hypothetical protein [Gossypium gossypioides]